MNNTIGDFPCVQSSTLAPDNPLQLDQMTSSPLQNPGLPHGDLGDLLALHYSPGGAALIVAPQEPDHNQPDDQIGVIQAVHEQRHRRHPAALKEWLALDLRVADARYVEGINEKLFLVVKHHSELH